MLNFTIVHNKRFNIFNYELLFLKRDNSKIIKLQKNCFICFLKIFKKKRKRVTVDYKKGWYWHAQIHTNIPKKKNLFSLNDDVDLKSKHKFNHLVIQI